MPKPTQFTRRQLELASERASQAGDTETVQAIHTKLMAGDFITDPEKIAQSERELERIIQRAAPSTPWDAFRSGFGQGATLGTTDEIQGAANWTGLGRNITQEESLAQIKKHQREHPGIGITGEIIGGLSTGGVGLARSLGAKATGMAGRGLNRLAGRFGIGLKLGGPGSLAARVGRVATGRGWKVPDAAKAAKAADDGKGGIPGYVETLGIAGGMGAVAGAGYGEGEHRIDDAAIGLVGGTLLGGAVAGVPQLARWGINRARPTQKQHRQFLQATEGMTQDEFAEFLQANPDLLIAHANPSAAATLAYGATGRTRGRIRGNLEAQDAETAEVVRALNKVDAPSSEINIPARGPSFREAEDALSPTGGAAKAASDTKYAEAFELTKGTANPWSKEIRKIAEGSPDEYNKARASAVRNMRSEGLEAPKTKAERMELARKQAMGTVGVKSVKEGSRNANRVDKLTESLSEKMTDDDYLIAKYPAQFMDKLRRQLDTSGGILANRAGVSNKVIDDAKAARTLSRRVETEIDAQKTPQAREAQQAANLQYGTDRDASRALKIGEQYATSDNPAKLVREYGRLRIKSDTVDDALGAGIRESVDRAKLNGKLDADFIRRMWKVEGGEDMLRSALGDEGFDALRKTATQLDALKAQEFGLNYVTGTPDSVMRKFNKLVDSGDRSVKDGLADGIYSSLETALGQGNLTRKNINKLWNSNEKVTFLEDVLGKEGFKQFKLVAQSRMRIQELLGIMSSPQKLEDFMRDVVRPGLGGREYMITENTTRFLNFLTRKARREKANELAEMLASRNLKSTTHLFKPVRKSNRWQDVVSGVGAYPATGSFLHEQEL